MIATNNKATATTIFNSTASNGALTNTNQITSPSRTTQFSFQFSKRGTKQCATYQELNSTRQVTFLGYLFFTTWKYPNPYTIIERFDMIYVCTFKFVIVLVELIYG